MAHKGLERWHRFMTTKDRVALSDFLHDDVVFFSPVVYTPQKGKQITMAYLTAAGESLADEFKYVKEIVDQNHVALEFECKIDGKYVNGMDIMTFDDDGKCVEFKVMVRPLQAVNAIHQSMMTILEKLKAS